MKAFRILLALVVACASLAIFATEPPASIRKEVEVYGTKTATSIEVRVDGAGIKKPGRYHVQPKTGLLELVISAEISGISNGRFTVTRVVDGYERNFGFRTNKEGKPALPAFDLSAGDFIYAGINLQ